MSVTLYLVLGPSGEYEDYYEETIGLYFKRENAEKAGKDWYNSKVNPNLPMTLERFEELCFGYADDDYEEEGDYAAKTGVPVVIATTALDDDEKNAVSVAANRTPVFLAYNMSFGIALLCDFAKKAAAAFPDADIEIVEAHHNRKVDAPSGTAVMLADSIKEVRPNAKYVYGRGGEAKRTPDEIGIHALRMANIVGEHEVYITTESQQLVLRHNAYDRSLFADGAVKAARFMVGRETGLYTMRDMFKS